MNPAVRHPICKWLQNPILIILVSFSILFITQNKMNGFLGDHHGNLSAHGMTLAKNLSLEKFLLQYNIIYVNDDGSEYYESYTRFPIFPFLVIKSAMQFGGDHFQNQIFWARQAMNFFLLLAAIMAFITIRMVSANSFVAFAAIWLAFASTPIAFYSDMVFNDVPALFGCTLAYFVVARAYTKQWNSKTNLSIALLSICMGWQPLAVYSAWMVVEGWKAAFLKSANPFFSWRDIAKLNAIMIGAGACILIIQLGQEWLFLGGSFMDLPTVESIVLRTGFSKAEVYSKLPVANSPQVVGRTVAKYTLEMLIPARLRKLFPDPLDIRFAILAIGIGFWVVIRFQNPRFRTAIATIALSAFFWLIPMRNFTIHHGFQAIFLLGSSLVVFSGLLSRLSHAPQIGSAIAALILFVTSVTHTNQEKNALADSKRVNAVTDSYELIQTYLPSNATVAMDGARESFGSGGYHSVSFYFSGRKLANLAKAQYLLSKNCALSYALLVNSEATCLYKLR